MAKSKKNNDVKVVDTSKVVEKTGTVESTVIDASKVTTGTLVESVKVENNANLEDNTSTKETVIVSMEIEETLSEKQRKEANRIMKANDVKEVWLCPKKGYWFTRKDYAENHGKKVDVVMRHILWED